MKIVKINGGKAVFERVEQGWMWSVHKRFKNGFPRRVSVGEGRYFILTAVTNAEGWAPTLRSARQNAHMQLSISC